jgi:ketosteroid isomerase-like protein
MTTEETRQSLRAAMEAWFRTLERCVRAVDYDTARSIFAPDVVAFGTRADVVRGIERLQVDQWSGVWPTIRGFTFDLSQLQWDWSGQSGWAVVTWTSTGFHPDGRPFARPGRATVIFVPSGGTLLAAHTHFSLAPGTPPRSYAPRATTPEA